MIFSLLASDQSLHSDHNFGAVAVGAQLVGRHRSLDAHTADPVQRERAVGLFLRSAQGAAPGWSGADWPAALLRAASGRLLLQAAAVEPTRQGTIHHPHSQPLIGRTPHVAPNDQDHRNHPAHWSDKLPYFFQ